MKSYVHMPSNSIDDFNRAAKARERERHLARERARLEKLGDANKPLTPALVRRKKVSKP